MTGAEALYSELRDIVEWVDVNERLPENQGIVLVKTDNNCFATAYLHGNKSGFITYGEDAYSNFGTVKY